MKRVIASLVLLSLTCPAFADGLLPEKPAVVQPVAAPSIPASVYVDRRIDVTKNSVPLHSRLAKTYSGYTYTIANNSDSTLELIHGEVTNGVNGQGAALGAEKSSAAAIGSVLGGGFVLGFVTLGISFLASLIASPVIYAANNHGNKKAIQEGMGFPGQVPTGVLSHGDTLNLNVLAPISQAPQLKLSFRNTATNELFSITR